MKQCHANNVWLIIFLLSIFGPATNVALLVSKCCPHNKELDLDLEECKEILSFDATERNIGRIYTNSSEEQVDIKRLPFIVSNSTWLPDSLRSQFDQRKLNVTVGRPTNCARTLKLRSIPPQDYDNVVHTNGTLELFSPTVFNDSVSVFFDPGEFCTDAYTDANGTLQNAILVCPCDRVKCVNKCCPLRQVMWCEREICDCKTYESEWKPITSQLSFPKLDFPFIVIDDQVPSCKEGFEPFMDRSTILPNHVLRTFWEYPGGKLFNEADLCADALVRSGVWRQEMIRCGSVVPSWARLSISYWLHVPEALLLGFTMATILLVPRQRMSAYSYSHDYAMACHALSLFVRACVWAVFTKKRMSEALCTYPPIIIYSTSVAAAFWLNVICINMTCGFWKPLGLQNGRWRGARRMFLFYSIYAWGATFALSAFTSAMWFLEEVPGGVMRPTFHETRTCYREEDGKGKIATFAYFFGPLIALLSINAFLFFSTASRVMLLRKNTKILGNKISSARDSSPHNRRSVIIYIKLVWLMGLVEVGVEVAAWASNTNEYYFTTAASCVDLLRAIAIFALSSCKKRTLRDLRRRLSSCCASLCPFAGASLAQSHAGHRGNSVSMTTVSEVSVVEGEE